MQDNLSNDRIASHFYVQCMPSYYIKLSNAFKDEVRMGIYLTVATEQGNLFSELGEQSEFWGT